MSKDEIVNLLKEGKSLVLVAPPGWGKTRLSPEIAQEFDSSLIVVRTHREIAEVLKFSAGTIVPAYGRPSICWRMRRDEFTYSACRAYNVLGNCDQKVREEDVNWLLAMPRSPEEIRERGKELSRCLYAAGLVAAKRSRHVVTTYDFVISNPWITEGRDIVIFDEAHTIINYYENYVISAWDIINELHAIYMRKKDRYVKRVITGIKSALRKGLGAEAIIDLLAGIRYDGGDVIKTIEKAYYAGRYIEHNNNVYFLLTDSLPVTVSVPTLAMSAYLIPSFFRADHVIEVESEPLVKVKIVDGVSSRYVERGEDTYVRMAILVRDSIRRDCGNLVVFPSKAFAEEVMKYLRVGKWADKGLTKIEKGEVVVDVAGGSLTEGANIEGLCHVIVAGMPYPEPSPVLDLLMKVFDFNIYEYVAELRTLQAIGRVRRGTATLIDDRFKEMRFPSWVTT